MTVLRVKRDLDGDRIGDVVSRIGRENPMSGPLRGKTWRGPPRSRRTSIHEEPRSETALRSIQALPPINV